MAAVLLSESKDNSNPILIEAVIDSLPTQPKLAYIPSMPDPHKYGYKTYFSGLMQQLGINDVEHFELEDDYWQANYTDAIYESNILFLPGGNTYRFAYWLKQRGFADIINEFTKNRLVIGVSAGAIVLTPRIDIAEDLNTVGINEFGGFAAVEVYFKPHFKESAETINHIQKFKSRLALSEQQKKIYACPDSAGLIVSKDGEIKSYGDIRIF